MSDGITRMYDDDGEAREWAKELNIPLEKVRDIHGFYSPDDVFKYYAKLKNAVLPKSGPLLYPEDIDKLAEKQAHEQARRASSPSRGCSDE